MGHAPHKIGLGDQFSCRENTRHALTGAVVLIEHKFDVLERYPLAVHQSLGQRGKQCGDGSGIGFNGVVPLFLTLLFLEGGHRFGNEVGG